MRRHLHAGLALAAVLAVGACSHRPPAAGASTLISTAWVAQAIGGKPVVGHVVLTLAFDESGRASGFGGCNRYAGPAEIAGESLRFGPLVSTRMACQSAQLNAQETRFLAVLGRAKSYVIDRDGWLVLTSDGEKKPSRLAPDPRPRQVQALGVRAP